MVLDIPLVCTFIAIIACFYASYTDLKTGIIQNKLTFSLIGLGIALNAVYAFMISDIWFIIVGLIFTALIFVLGYIFWKLGAWAGGDVKLFTALAALLPSYPLALKYNIWGVAFPVVSNYGFPFTLIINSILAILPFLLIYVFYIAIIKKPYLVDELLAPVKEYRKNIVLSLVITVVVILTYYYIYPLLPYQILLLALILIYVLTFIISKTPNRIKAIVISILTVFVLYNNFYNLQFLSSMIILFILTFISLTAIGIIRKILTSVNKKALQDDYEINDLKEGMIPAYNMYERDNEVYVDNKSFFEKMKESIKNGNPTGMTVPKGKLLISTMAAGLTDENVILLKKLSDENKIDSKIKIKRGVPFAPSILIGLLISLFIGDLAIIIQKILYVILY